MIEYSESREFKKDFKALKKKFKTLPQDFALVKRASIELFHIKGIDNQGIFEIKKIRESVSAYKIKKFACKSLKGRGAKSGLRVIYTFDKAKLTATFLEIYFKADKENENRSRIVAYAKNLKDEI